MVLPQLRLALCGGGLLIALHLLAEFGLYGLIRFDTFTTATMDQFQSAYDPAANVLASVLVVCSLTVLVIEAAARGDARYSRIGPGAARMATRVALGRAAPLCLLVIAAMIVLAVGVPLVTLGRWLIVGGASI